MEIEIEVGMELEKLERVMEWGMEIRRSGNGSGIRTSGNEKRRKWDWKLKEVEMGVKVELEKVEMKKEGSGIDN